MTFVHLHTHTQYSLLDDASRIDDLMEKAKKFNMPALAITDHGNMYGVIDFYQTAVKKTICFSFLSLISLIPIKSNIFMTDAKQLLVLKSLKKNL